MFLLGPSIHIP